MLPEFFLFYLLGAAHAHQLEWHWLLRTVWWIFLLPLAILCWVCYVL